MFTRTWWLEQAANAKWRRKFYGPCDGEHARIARYCNKRAKKAKRP